MFNDVCAITLLPLKSGKDKKGVPRTLSLECGHSFDARALANWLKISESVNCPICRGPPVIVYR